MDQPPASPDAQSPAFVSFVSVALPVELVTACNQAYFLHVLATDPDRVLPPGKSILSMMSRRGSAFDGHRGEQPPPPSLQETVEDIAHKAFWDEAVDSLSSPEPSVQLARLKGVYLDVHDAIKPLLPPQHPVLVTLSSHLSPTPSPLRSAAMHLREVLSALRTRCAPVRDADIDDLLHSLDELTPANAKSLVETVKSIHKIVKAMKEDLSQFVLGSMSEKKLRGVIREQAQKEERAVVLALWTPEQLRRSWLAWLGELHPLPPEDAGLPSFRWIMRLIQALAAPYPLACELPLAKSIPSASSGDNAEPLENAPKNALPPQFLLTAPSLLYLQNYLQALVIAAALRSLTYLPPAPSLPKAPPSTEAPAPHVDFMGRIWALLRAEVNEEPGSGTTKLVNLADEVVRARRSVAVPPLEADGETRLRAAVERTLQPSDPVFMLLQKRLMATLATRLVQPRPKREHHSERMQTGRDRNDKRRPQLNLNLPDVEVGGLGSASDYVEPSLVMKGFEDPVLVGAAGEALGRLRVDMEWVFSVWEDFLSSENTAMNE